MYEGLFNVAFEILADRMVCDRYLSQEEGFSEEERKQRISEYLLLHCEMEKCLYLTGATMLKCTAAEDEKYFIPTDHNVYIAGLPAIAATDCIVGKHITPFGICRKQSEKASEDIYCNPKIAYNKWLESCLRMKVGDADSVNENSYLICTRYEGARIYPVISNGPGEYNSNSNVRECSEDFFRFLKGWETGGIRPTLESEMVFLNMGEFAEYMYYDSNNKPTIGWGHLIVLDSEGQSNYTFMINGNTYTKNLMNERISKTEAEYLLQQDIEREEEELNSLLDDYKLTTTQREYDVLLSLYFNLGNKITKYKQTGEWLKTGGYKDIEYSKFVLGDLTDGGKLKNRRADELEILMGNSNNTVITSWGDEVNSDYSIETSNSNRITSESGESIWNNTDKIDELCEKWERENNIIYEED